MTTARGGSTYKLKKKTQQVQLYSMDIACEMAILNLCSELMD